MVFGLACGESAAPAPPAAPAEFEVATIKEVHPEGFSFSTGMTFDPAMVRVKGLSLYEMFLTVYKVRPYQLTAPDWIQSTRFDITARIPKGHSQQEVLFVMLRTLLEKRFQMKTHRETKLLPAYALVLARGGLKIQPSTTSSGAGMASSGHMEIFGDMSLVAASLTGLDRPVVDQTGVKGTFNITLDFAPDEEHEAAGMPPLRTVLEEKLGLKLEPRKLPIEMLVIDHIERKPTKN
jgi:uncharacterized protein (TIGR03435 family)